MVTCQTFNFIIRRANPNPPICRLLLWSERHSALAQCGLLVLLLLLLLLLLSLLLLLLLPQYC